MRQRLTTLLFLILNITLCVAQNDDIQLTDSTSSEWGGSSGGGLKPQEPTDPVTSLTLSQTKATLEGGERVRLVATVNQRARNKRIIWTSVNEDIASVDANGTVMGLTVGTTTIIATAAGNTSLRQKCQVTVTSNYIPPVSGYILPWGREKGWIMKYQKVDYNMEPGDISWTKSGFNDSAWPTLTGPMGNSGERNYEWEGDYNGFNLRCTFDMPVVSNDATYTFYAIHDDDLWVYLNGELITHFEGWSDWQERAVNIPASKFVRGTNQLALRVMQGSGGSYLDYALYQKSPRKATSFTLPNVPFEFFYSAKDYDESDPSIPNQSNANLAGASLTLTENLPQKIGDMLRITERCEGFIDCWEKGSAESGAHFYREGEERLTLVAKLTPRLNTNNVCDFITNRSGGHNYMWRIGDHNSMFLHTGDGYNDNRVLPLSSEQPQVLAVRVDGKNDYILLQNLTTREQLRVDGVHWGGGDNVFKIFYNDGGEYFLGDFYWMYYSFEYLTDSELETFLTIGEATKAELEWPLREGWNWVSHNLADGVNPWEVLGENVMEAKSQTKGLMRDSKYGMVGNLIEMLPTESYKVKVSSTGNPCHLSGYLFNTSTHAVGLKKGWNWMGCPIAEPMDINYALIDYAAEEGDFIVAQEGFAQYHDQEWFGTIDQLIPGKGYMYKSSKDGEIFFPKKAAQVKTRLQKGNKRGTEDCPWTCDLYLYPNIMPTTIKLYNDGVEENLNNHFVAAFCGDECRGVGKIVKGVVMMNVCGEGNEIITFKAINKNTGIVMNIKESVPFTGDVLGTYTEPFQLNLDGESSTGIETVQSSQLIVDGDTIYNLAGQRMAMDQKILSKGVYIIRVKNGKAKRVLIK